MKLGHDIEDSRSRWSELRDEQLLKELDEWTKSRSLPKVPVEQLAIFAHSCYYDRAATLRCMEAYYKLKATVPEFFKNRDPLLDSLKSVMEAVYYAELPKTDKQGNRIIIHGLLDANASRYMFNDSVKLLIMTMEASLYSAGCAPGYIFLFDMRGVKISHLTRLTVTGIRRFFEYIQEAMPVRLKAIHVLNCVWFMDKVLALIRPFMKKELFDILHLHSGDVSEVYRYIPAECVPKDFGGELDDVETLHAENCRKLVGLRDYFLEEERLYRGYQSPSKKSAACAGVEEVSHERDGDVGADEGS